MKTPKLNRYDDDNIGYRARKWLLFGIFKYKWRLLSLLFMSISLGFVNIITIVFLQKFTDIIYDFSNNKIGLPAIFLVSSAFVTLMLSFFISLFRARLDKNVAGDLIPDFMKCALESRFSWSEAHTSAGIITRIQEFSRVQALVTDGLLRTVSELVFFVLALYYAINVSVALTVIASVSFPLSFALARLGSTLVIAPATEALGVQTRLQQKIIESIEHRDEINHFAGSALWLRQIGSILDLSLVLGIRLQSIDGVLRLLNGICVRGVEFAVLGLGAIAVRNGDMTIGQLLAFLVLLIRLTNPMTLIASLGEGWRQMSVSLRRMEEVLVPESPRNWIRQRGDGADGLVIDALEVRVGMENQVLCVPKMNVMPGSILEVRGSTGIGKTTLLRAIAGLTKPLAGTVAWHFGGPANRSQQEVIYLAAYPYVAPASVRENITFGTDIERELVEKVYIDVKARLETNEFPFGIDEIVENDGIPLSAGQRQILGLMRALARQPKILLLDEATSHLRTEAEHRVLELVAMCVDVSILIIATHRELPASLVAEKLHFSRLSAENVVVTRSAEPGSTSHLDGTPF